MGYIGIVEIIYDEDEKHDQNLLPLVVAYLQQQQVPLEKSLLEKYTNC
jgi:hypothetical protein